MPRQEEQCRPSPYKKNQGRFFRVKSSATIEWWSRDDRYPIGLLKPISVEKTSLIGSRERVLVTRLCSQPHPQTKIVCVRPSGDISLLLFVSSLITPSITMLEKVGYHLVMRSTCVVEFTPDWVWSLDLKKLRDFPRKHSQKVQNLIFIYKMNIIAPFKLVVKIQWISYLIIQNIVST